jgi:glucokinase
LSFVSEQMGPAATKMWRDHPAAAVIDAHADTDPGCASALDLFIRALGAVAGDAALRILPTGGVWIVGGVAGRLLRPNGDAALRTAFEAKGRMSSAIAALPILVVDDPEIVLRGAVVVARAAMH